MDKTRLPEIFRKLLPYIITTVLLVVIFEKVSLKETLSHLEGRTVWRVVPLAIVFYTYVFFSNSFCYYVLFHRLKRPIGYWEALSIRGASYLLTALNSGVGQGGLALWISRKMKIPLKEVIGIMFVFPITDVIFIAIMLSISLLLHCLGKCTLPLAHARILYWAVLVAWLIPLLHFAMWPTGFLPKYSRFLRESVLFTAFRRARIKDYLVILASRALMDIPGVLAYYAGISLFGAKVPFWIFVVRFFPAIVIQGLPVTVGLFGTSQSAWILMYKDYVAPAVLIAFSLLWITIYNLSRIIIGAIFFRGEARYYFEKAIGTKKQENAPVESR